MMIGSFVRWRQAMFVFSLAALLAGCAAPPPPPPPPPPSNVPLPFDEAVAQATDGLVRQTQRMPGLTAGASGVGGTAGAGGRSGVVMDPMLEAGSDQQTLVTQRLQDRVAAQLAEKASVQLVPFQRENLGKANYLLTGTMTRLEIGKPNGPMRIDLALTDLAGGDVVAQSSAVTLGEGLDHTPLRFFQDSPVVPMDDRVTEGYVKTSGTAPGLKADPYYLAHLEVAPLIENATTAYNAGRYEDALTNYSAASDSEIGEQMRVFSGVYLAAWKLGRTEEAERAFGKLVAYGITHQRLGVKFLFSPNGMSFLSEQQISGPYAMWLREIARVSVGAKVCMDIVGHTSHTGSESYNDTLSLQRAKYIQQRLVGDAAELRTRTMTSGKGFHENLIGSGTDDAIDALDRRVEFKIVDCGTIRAAR
jgi:outer membrane protein OmpA-like peptidoglycan-associated protein